ncbi:sporulation protein [Streptomyces sp. TRM 70351]|uniref:sporulation protein n=1 Tax=Streptomyces sp. TRM 70351 TaxID=3116552 RepID=UPI002E7B0701|nr:sporulation protein [Streptomyces sp. TRM 70351]MEE1930162.1 sporulation protein [Streptomyces sp. TRM 70351]
MVFKRLLGSLGVGGPTVDTVLSGGPALPGGPLRGQVHLKGGTAAHEIEHVTLELVARVEAEHAEGEDTGTVAFERYTVGGGFRLDEGAEHVLPFEVPLPWEVPVTELHGQPLGVVLGVRTELGVAGARDKSDLDAVAVAPLPVQEAVLEALGQLGFVFVSADLELGRIQGTAQRLPFYQEIELSPPQHQAHALSQLEVTFLAAPDGVDVVLEADRRGAGPFGAFGGGDALNRHTVAHEDAGQRDWTAVVAEWVRQLVDGRTHPGGHHAGHAGGHGHGGPGVGAAVAAGAAGLAVGVAGGLVAAEIVDEIGDALEDDAAEDAFAGDAFGGDEGDAGEEG